MIPRLRNLAPLVFLGAAACGGERPDYGDGLTTKADQEPMWVDLIDNTAWVQVDAAADPLADHRPETVECGAEGNWFDPTTGQFDVYTGKCNYFMGIQPSLVPIQAGERLAVAFFHGILFADEPATAHVALVVGQEVVWELQVDIPNPNAVFYQDWVAETDIPVGTPIGYHVHNHGPNTYVIGEFMVETTG